MNYTKDEFHGITWRWRFNSIDKSIESLWCFCPHDDTELIWNYGFRGYIFECETCGRSFVQVKGASLDLDEVLDKIKRQIQRKLRSGIWKEIVLKQN